MNPTNGDCIQAVFASLFEKELDEVPKFIELKEDWFQAILDFCNDQGYSYNATLYNNNLSNPEFTTLDEVKYSEGIDGLFYAGVRSPKFWKEGGGTHAVIIDKDFNIVHDPNPLYKDIESYPDADILGYNGIIDVAIIERIKND